MDIKLRKLKELKDINNNYCLLLLNILSNELTINQIKQLDIILEETSVLYSRNNNKYNEIVDCFLQLIIDYFNKKACIRHIFNCWNVLVFLNLKSLKFSETLKTYKCENIIKKLNVEKIEEAINNKLLKYDISNDKNILLIDVASYFFKQYQHILNKVYNNNPTSIYMCFCQFCSIYYSQYNMVYVNSENLLKL